jgi:hypothetical protein
MKAIKQNYFTNLDEIQAKHRPAHLDESDLYVLIFDSNISNLQVSYSRKVTAPEMLRFKNAVVKDLSASK